MKLYKVSLDNVDYDDYDGCIILANSKEQVKDLLVDEEFLDSQIGFRSFIRSGQNMIIEEIKIESFEYPRILLASYNAG